MLDFRARMDCQPVNLFIRGSQTGALLTLAHTMTVYKYLTPYFHEPVIADAEQQARNLGVPMYVTTYRYYTQLEAVRALALPGPLPTHVLEIDLPAGAELQGPAFIEPLAPGQTRALPREHRWATE